MKTSNYSGRFLTEFTGSTGFVQGGGWTSAVEAARLRSIEGRNVGGTAE
jgi:hypothetical protein